jgi:type II secretory pathway component PulF
LRTLALARFAWALEITLGAGMAVVDALALSLRATQSPRYRALTAEVTRGIKAGREIHEVLDETRVFPREFLDAIEVGERSGRLPETMAVVSEQYQDQARHALAALTMVAGFAVWALVAGLIVLMIFRIFMTAYLGPINEALEGI